MKTGLKKMTILVCLIVLMSAWARPMLATEAKLLEVRRIWDEARHNAFTDLVHWKGQWYCTFREGYGHISPREDPEGHVRVITSTDGRQWTSAALMKWAGQDLRDPKFCVMPDGRLMLNSVVWLRPAIKRKMHQSLVWFSDDGHNWSEHYPIGDPNVWLWSATCHKGVCYSMGYSTAPDRFVRLYRSRDGRKWETVADKVFTEGWPNENSLVFTKDDTCFCLLRCRAGTHLIYLGTAKPPYTDWTWKKLRDQVSGGPKMIQLPDGRLIAGVKLRDGRHRAAICWIDTENGRMHELVTLPSGGDHSYLGLVWHEGLLWVSYYSGHEGKTSIYLAKVKIEPATP